MAERVSLGHRSRLQARLGSHGTGMPRATPSHVGGSGRAARQRSFVRRTDAATVAGAPLGQRGLARLYRAVHGPARHGPQAAK